MSPAYYALILSFMADDDEMAWDDMKQVMFYLKDEVDFEVAE